MVGLSFGCIGCDGPISWMGNKRAYKDALMKMLGLSRLNPPSAYVWGDVGPNIAALACLFGAAGSAEEVARYLAHYVRSHPGGGGFIAPDHRMITGSRAGDVFHRYLPEDPAPLVDLIPSPRAPEVAAIIRGWRDEEPRALWSRLKAAGWPSLLLPEGSGGRWLGPVGVEEVAAWLLAIRWSFSEKGPEHGYGGPGRPVNTINANWTMEDRDKALSIERFTGILESNKSAPRVACWQGRAEDMRLPGDLSGWVCLLDPPYKGDCTKKITGYKHGDISRDHLLCLADSYDRRGAVVAICESVSLRADFGDGWHAVDIGGERKGQARTFGNTSEWVTMNRKPVVVPGVQASLFGAP
jgi:hypothetical protein